MIHLPLTALKKSPSLVDGDKMSMKASTSQQMFEVLLLLLLLLIIIIIICRYSIILLLLLFFCFHDFRSATSVNYIF